MPGLFYALHGVLVMIVVMQPYLVTGGRDDLAIVMVANVLDRVLLFQSMRVDREVFSVFAGGVLNRVCCLLEHVVMSHYRRNRNDR